MHSIEQKAIQTFQENLLYLSENHPKVYRKIDILGTAMENGSYKEKYALEYKKEDYFDILEIASNKWFYELNSVEQGKKEAKDINFTKNLGTIETFYNYSFDEKGVETANNEDPTSSQFVTTAPIISFVSNLYDKNTTMKHIFKFIFFGVGLGTHIHEIHKKINASIYMIIEDNLEIFRLSLFVTNYANIGKDSELYFSIMENNSDFKKKFDAFFHNSFIRNNYLKYSILYPNYREKIAKIQNFIVTQSSNTYLHDKLLQKNTRVIQNIHKNYNFFDVSSRYDNSLFSSRPIILVAAGPSLTKKIKWLKKNAPFVTVVALFMTAPILSKHGIRPDIVIHVDEGRLPVIKNLDNIKEDDFFDLSVFLLSPSVGIDLFEKITDKNKIFMFEDRTRYRFNKGFLESFSVGEIAYALSLILGAKEIYLLGLDLALDPETKKTHAEGHLSSNNNAKLKNAQDDEIVSLRGSEFYVRGNFIEVIPTIPLFETSIHILNQFTNEFKKDYQQIYNLNNGAYFENTTPTKSENIDLSSFGSKNRYEFHQNLLTFFTKNSSNILDDDEKLAFNRRIEETNIKRNLILEFSKQRYPLMKQFQSAFVEMASEIIKAPQTNTNELSQIFVIYLENIGGYIGDFLNTAEIDNPKRNIKHFQKIITVQLLKILDKYLEILRKVE